MSKLNDKLLLLQEDWIHEVVEPFVVKFGDSNEFSRPFHFGVSENISDTDNLIMIIGQEPDGFWNYSDKNLSPEVIQRWCLKYYDKQVFNIEFFNYNYYNSSPFWNFFRKIGEKGYSTCWNNLDKIHRYSYVNNVKKTLSLSLEQELFLNKPYGLNKKTLLINEIETVNPEALIFVTGPDYFRSMATALRIKDSSLVNKPSVNDFCVDISEVVNIGKSVFWTYHPGFLLRNKGATDSVVDFICNRVR